MDDLTIEEFKERLSAADDNVKELLGFEPSVGRIILYLSMAAALDCADAAEPDDAITSDMEIIDNILDLVPTVEGRKVEKTEFKEPVVDDDEWLDLFLDAQGFLEDVINSHLEEYGGDTEEQRVDAYTEVSNTLVYMCASACSMCDDPSKAAIFCRESIKETYKFINEECTLVSKDEIEE